MRPQKTIRLNYTDPEETAAITILGDPPEMRVGSAPNSFIATSPDGTSISGGFPSTINIQGMSSSMRYAGMLQDIPFPLSMIPSTAATPAPKQIFKPPFMEQLPMINQLAAMSLMFLR